MATGAVFPAFIRATYQETSDGLPAFERAMQTSVNRAQKAAQVSMDQITREISSALGSGKSDLGASDLRIAAAAADMRAQSARQIATAMSAAAAAENDYSLATQASVMAARRLADEEENAARMANLHVVAVERINEVARQNSISLMALSDGNVVAARSSNAHRQAQMMLAQQMQDVAIQMQLGINPLMILTQQGSQAAFSLAQIGGKAAAVGRFLSSPWVAALAIAGTALSSLLTKSEDTADALEKIKFSSDAVGDAQGIMGNAMDLATGKITTQRKELIALAIAQSKVAAIQAQARAVSLRGEVQSLQQSTTELSGGFGGGFDVRRVDAGARGAISRSFLAGEIDSKTAVQRLDNLRKAGALTDEAFASAAKSIASLGVELANVKTFEAAERLLNGAGTSRDRGLLLKPKIDRSPKAKIDPQAEIEKALFEDRLQAQGNVGKLAAEMAERQLAWGKDQVTLGDQMIQQGKDLQALDEARAQGAQQVLDAYLRQLDALQRLGGLTGGLAGIAEGILDGGNFYGVNGKAGDILRAFSPMVGEDGWKNVTEKLDDIFGGEGEFKKGMTKLLQGSGAGQMAAGLLLGGANNTLGSSIGGALGGKIGDKIGQKIADSGAKGLMKGLGDFAGPLGSIAGGLLGGALGGVFSKPKWGTAVVNGQSKEDVSVAGNKAAYRSNAGLAGTSIQSGLGAIAEQLGADVGDYNVSIGQYKGKWRVSSSGRSGKLKTKYGDVTDFGKEGGEDAIKFAISDAVKDGALLGLRASTQALLTRSSDIEGQLQKALDFEGVFQRLKEYNDPVGAALDTLDKEFSRLKKIFAEAGASTEEYSQLEELYGKERAAAVKDSAEKVTASLKSLFDELTVGNDARSLRERMVEAQATYSPLAQRVAAGDTSAYDDYSDAARTLLDLQRQVYGSSEDYFKLLDQVTALTKTRIDDESNIASISAARESLFASDSAVAPVVSATESQTQQIVSALNFNNQSLLSQMQVQTENLIAVGRLIANLSGNRSSSTALPTRQNF
ncbi:hypothetical protein Sphch_3141 [Sphingobium chlorophenolicum L-1]|uniref:Bacteriophage tail tape measure N-terminal domain-containing protein n=1 Tax=Sphingobium chlorophenolicum L-1 TaxID=690566 RepID=F6F2U4_SPHCR|nr:hypothetical protein [Sphingobium chlorophenolicum]AEG50756.1 hypothetical protein Sphch_3141 [Sphingobium chlorophenolicum L-1]